MTMTTIRSLTAAIAVSAVLILAVGCGDNTPPATDGGDAPAADAPKKPLLLKKEMADWCPEHGVPESICTRCNESLVASFKEKGDWCGGHGLPESQCFKCNPGLEAEFAAGRPSGVGDEAE